MRSWTSRTAVLLAGIGLSVLGRPSAAQCALDEDAKLEHAGQWYGISVSLSRGRAVVVAPVYGAAWQGWVHIYEERGGKWGLVKTLTNSTYQEGFGISADLRGDVLAVGILPPYFPLGRVRMFEKQADDWVHMQTLGPSVPVERLGQRLDLADDALIAAAEDAAFIFERQGEAWVETAHIVALGASFLPSVAIDAGIAVVGLSNTQEVLVFRKTGTSWGLETVLSTEGVVAGDGFGGALALSDGRIVVGAPGAGLTGAAYVFESVGGTWTQTAKLVVQGSQGIGQAVSVYEHTVLLGGAGAAYVFRLHEGAWFHTAKLAASDDSGEFGATVSLSGEDALVGAPLMQYGAAYVLPTECIALLGAPATISLVAGGSHSFALDAGPMHPLAPYMLLGTTAGTAPGQPLPPSPWTLPLNPSGYFRFTLFEPNTLIDGSLGLLDGSGKANANLMLAPGLDAALAGLTLDHAFLVFDPSALSVVFTSNAETLTLVP